MTVVVAAITNDRSELFLIKRNNPGVNYDQHYALPGGKINFGEDPKAAVKREVLEETGFEVEVQDVLPAVWSNMLTAAGESEPSIQAILIAYRCKKISGEFKPDGREVSAGGFFSKDILQKENCMKPAQEVFELISK